MAEVKASGYQNMFSKADSSWSNWSKDQQQQPQDEGTHHSLQKSPTQQSFPRQCVIPFANQNIENGPISGDFMTPQSICFIGDEEDVEEHETPQVMCLSDEATLGQQLQSNFENEETFGSKLNITSGNLTYRIPSPSRPLLNANRYQNPNDKNKEKGFYISFDDEQPKRPKPPLRPKRSLKKSQNLIYEGNQQASYDQESNFNDGLIQNNSKNASNATYNKYTEGPMLLKQLACSKIYCTTTNNKIPSDRRHLVDVTNQQQKALKALGSSSLVVGTDNIDNQSVDEMERKKEKIMLLSLQRRQQQEEAKARKEIEENRRREREREKDEERARKKEEQITRRASILEQHRLKKAIVNAEREGKAIYRSETIKQQSQSASAPHLRQQKVIRSRPKTIHIDVSETLNNVIRGKKGLITSSTGYGGLDSNHMKKESTKGSQHSLTFKALSDVYLGASSTSIDQTGGNNSRGLAVERSRTLSRLSITKKSNLNTRERKSNSLINLCNTGLGRATPPHRAPSPGITITSNHMSSSSGPGSLLPNSSMEYSGPKLYKQPIAKSNRGIILNAVEYCVFPGAVNHDAKQIVLEKIARSESKHFLVLFRDAGCQFRALYSYAPESDQINKLYGTGPIQVNEGMFDKFFKYNSGAKCFSQVHTKHLTVTIDAFTIHNSLWQGKKMHPPSKKEMTLVI